MWATAASTACIPRRWSLTQDPPGAPVPRPSYLGRALGLDATVEIDYRHWPLAEGEVYLLATDGPTST
jgi:serine/threonine protein phosphatase PrpC